MKRVLTLCFFLISISGFSQVALPTEYTVAFLPLEPIDMSQLTEAEMDDPLSVLSDTALIEVKVMFQLESTLDLETVQIKILRSETSTELFDIILPLNGEMPVNYSREENQGFFVFNLPPLEYSGGLMVQTRLTDVSGNHSTYLTYPEN